VVAPDLALDLGLQQERRQVAARGRAERIGSRRDWRSIMTITGHVVLDRALLPAIPATTRSGRLAHSRQRRVRLGRVDPAVDQPHHAALHQPARVLAREAVPAGPFGLADQHGGDVVLSSAGGEE